MCRRADESMRVAHLYLAKRCCSDGLKSQSGLARAGAAVGMAQCRLDLIELSVVFSGYGCVSMTLPSVDLSNCDGDGIGTSAVQLFGWAARE
jgi:hypothetical protein